MRTHNSKERKPIRIVFIGPQGSGKGTQADIIAQKLSIAHISAGDVLRSYQGSLKKKIDDLINHGNLVPDTMIVQILNERLAKPDCKNGFILDGYPRNAEQAAVLDKITHIDEVIEIHISDKTALERIENRISCKHCGKVYNTKTNPSKKPTFCDRCGGDLYKRVDDNPAAIKKRLEIYHKETEPILQEFKSVRVNGEAPPEKVAKEILKALKK